MKISKTNPILGLARWALSQKWLMRHVPTMFRYGGWLLMMIYHLFGMKVLLITTTGRKSGKPRTTPVMYVKQDENYYVSAIPPRNQRYPNWYLNLMADPNVMVELFWRRRSCHSAPVQGEAEKLALLAQFPFGLTEAIQDYSPSEIPVIRLEPITR